ncbi:MAG: YegP family protein [Solirubrobacteraceae bacterium]
MGTAPKKSRAAGLLAPPARDVRVPESMEFLIFEDNGGAYHWRIVGGDGATLAQSESLASYDAAEQAARRVRDGAASARFNRRAGELGAVDLATRRDRPSDDLNAERWLDEGGSFTREAVARWPDRR